MIKYKAVQNNDTTDSGSWVEFYGSSSKDGEGFITAARPGEREEDERVVIITPRQALKLARALIAWALKRL